MDLKQNDIEKIYSICNSHHVERFHIFGSAASGNLKKNSDVDVLVQFSDIDLYYYFENLLSLKEELEKLFNRPVDILEEQALKNPYLKKSIDRNKILLYERKDTQMAL
jgi:predicted nucleotidyltransferase